MGACLGCRKEIEGLYNVCGRCAHANGIAPSPPTEIAPCAAVIDGERCGEPESEPPHGKMSGHWYVAPTENARVGADEHDDIARIFVNGWVPGFSRESRERMVSQLASQLRGAHGEALAAGRARGIEEERKRCERTISLMVAELSRRAR